MYLWSVTQLLEKMGGQHIGYPKTHKTYTQRILCHDTVYIFVFLNRSLIKSVLNGGIFETNTSLHKISVGVSEAKNKTEEIF